MTRPTLLKGLLDSWQLTLANAGARHLVPYWIVGSITAGVLAVSNLPVAFWDGSERDTVVSAFGGLLTFNGIVLALCWSAFAKVYEIIGAGKFSAHLRKHNLLGQYLVFVRYCHLAQITAISCAAFAMAAVWLPFTTTSLKVIVGAAIATSIYAVRQGYATSEAMQDLIWRKAQFDEQGSGELKPVASTSA